MSTRTLRSRGYATGGRGGPPPGRQRVLPDRRPRGAALRAPYLWCDGLRAAAPGQSTADGARRDATRSLARVIVCGVAQRMSSLELLWTLRQTAPIVTWYKNHIMKGGAHEPHIRSSRRRPSSTYPRGISRDARASSDRAAGSTSLESRRDLVLTSRQRAARGRVLFKTGDGSFTARREGETARSVELPGLPVRSLRRASAA